MVSTLDFESSDPSSSLGGTSFKLHTPYLLVTDMRAIYHLPNKWDLIVPVPSPEGFTLHNLGKDKMLGELSPGCVACTLFF